MVLLRNRLRGPRPTLLRALLGVLACLALQGSSCRVESCSGDDCGGEGGDDDGRTRTLVVRPWVLPAPGPGVLLVPVLLPGPLRPSTQRD